MDTVSQQPGLCTATEECVTALTLFNKVFLHSSNEDQEVI